MSPSAVTTHSAAPKIIIDEEFKFLLPRLDPESHTALEASILEHGIRDAIVIWKGHDILIDGHNRYGIAQKHDLPFKTTELEFPTREDVIIWMITTQIARRNLSPLQFTYFLGLQYKAAKKVRGGLRTGAGRKKEGGENENTQIADSEESSSENRNLINSQQGRTAEILGNQHGLARSTVVAAEKVADGITAIGKTSKEAKRKIIDGEARISRKRLTQLGTAPSPEVKDVARSIDAGTFGKSTDADTTTNPSKPPSTTALEHELLTATTDYRTRLKSSTTTQGLKAATRIHITHLESLLNQPSRK